MSTGPGVFSAPAPPPAGASDPNDMGGAGSTDSPPAPTAPQN